MSELKSRLCPICGRSSDHVVAEQRLDEDQYDAYTYASRKVPEFMHFRLILCKECDLIFANPAPESHSLHHEYINAAFDSMDEEDFAASTYIHYLPTHETPHHVLDIGCGGGKFLSQLLKRGARTVVGVEPSLSAANTADPTIRPHIHTQMFNAEDFKPNSFDLVSSFQALEHVASPLDLLKGAHTLLKPGGKVYIVSHNRKGIVNRLLGRRSPIFDIEHLQLFSPHSLRKIAEAAGFKQLYITAILNRYPLTYWVKLLPIPCTLKRMLIALLKVLRLNQIPVSLPVGNMALHATKV